MGIFLGLLAFVWWIILSVVVGCGAQIRGRSGKLYSVLSLLFSPFIGAFIVLMLGPVNGYGTASGGSYSSSYGGASTASSASVPYVEHSNDATGGTSQDTWVCKHCGAQNSRNSLMCSNCGEYK